MRVGPSESTHQDLTSYRGPGAWESQKKVVLRGQRCEMLKSHRPGDIFGHKSGPWARRDTRIGQSESIHQNLTSYGGPGAWGLQKRLVLKV